MPFDRYSSVAAPPSSAGVGLRPRHHARVREQRPKVSWFEVHAENFMGGGMLAEDLDDIRRDYPISLHAVGLSLGSVGGVNPSHAKALKALIDRYSPCLVSDHLSWSENDGFHMPDLLPLPYSEEALTVTARNIECVQDIVGRSLLIENPSIYLEPADSTIPEPEFLAELSSRTGCGVLLDVNNVFVSATNMRRDADQAIDSYLAALPSNAIGEIHLAGHAEVRTKSGAAACIDDHGSPVADAVWRLYERVVAALGPRPTLIEWDTNIPDLEVLTSEASRAQAIIDAYQGRHAHAHAG